MPYPGVTILRQGWSSELTPSAVRSVSPRALIVERWYWNPSIDWRQDALAQAGHDIAAQYFKLPVDKAANYHQIVNEPVVINTTGTVSFWNGALDYADSIGVKLTVLNTPYFWPALPGETRTDGADTTFWIRPDTFALMERIIAGGHILNMHEYIYPDPAGAWDSGPMMRHEQAIAELPIALRAVPIVLSEYGTGKAQNMSDQQFIAGVQAGDRALHSGRANVKAAMLWVAGPWKGDASDFGQHRSALVSYQKGARF